MPGWTIPIHTLLQWVSGNLILDLGTKCWIYKVINPMIRMSWIQRQWEQDFIDKAETAIQQLVSPFMV